MSFVCVKGETSMSYKAVYKLLGSRWLTLAHRLSAFEVISTDSEFFFYSYLILFL